MYVINDSTIEYVSLHQPYHWFLRWDVAPFTVIYTVLFSLIFNDDNDNIYSLATAATVGSAYIPSVSKAKLIAFIAIPIALTIHIVIFFIAQSSVSFRCMLGHKKVKSLNEASRVLVKACKHAGNDKIVDLHNPITDRIGNVAIAGINFSSKGSFFEFQKIKYSYNEQSKSFQRLEYPTKASVVSFLSHTGYSSDADVLVSQQKWGVNNFDIPVPDFMDLYVQHLVAPFFVFQVLCLLLWSLDDYWYYSVLTLAMLMFFEGMLCKQRERSLTDLRRTRKIPYRINIYRNNRWSSCSTEELLPGDIISVTTERQKKRNRRQQQQQQGDEGEADAGYDESQDNNHIDDKYIPCDALLIRGSCVVNEAMLTGESVPQLKENLYNADERDTGTVTLGVDNNTDAIWKRHVLFGGTTLVQHSYEAKSEKSTIPDSPDSGCIAVVVRTGYGTSQGGLMRKILFATERVSANSKETFFFIGFLVIFAIVASSVVLHGGLQDKERNRFKLVLHCIMIITSVVPPELPMELSLAVTNSLGALQQQLVYCTEPFRIPLAGKLDVLCFDKTGTLTKDKMVLKEIIKTCTAVSKEKIVLTSSAATTTTSAIDVNGPDAGVSDAVLSSIMGCCHSLIVSQEGRLVGDPLESATFEQCGFQFQSLDGLNMVHVDLKLSMRILRRFPFSSSLKRMSVVVEQSSATAPPVLMLFTKGAPEVIQEKLVAIPEHYQTTYLHHMNKGKRVLTVAYRDIHSFYSRMNDIKRSELEKDLVFAGFLIFDCELKPDSKSVIKELSLSNHRLIMITGDSANTAADVSKRLDMLRDKSLPILILQTDSSNALYWQRVDDVNTTIAYKAVDVSKLAATYNLCVTGASLTVICAATSSTLSNSINRPLMASVCIFARVSPAQKESIVIALNEAGNYTLMCGDGTNDVGALKAAVVGVSIVNDPDFEGRLDRTRKSEKKAKGQTSKDRQERLMTELTAIESDNTLVKPGDASIASPFTARRTSIDSVLTVIRQGRCTLVTTIQVYKILALNCLVSAYMMSALYLKGLKQGDTQMTASGLATAALFFFLSQSTPQHRISPKRPPNSVFATSIITSIIGQFTIHLASLLATFALCSYYTRDDNERYNSPDARFRPNLVNSAVYLLTATMQINNFVINYRGEPFTLNIQENLKLWRSVQGIYLILLILVGGTIEPLNDLLQLAPFPNPQFQVYLIGILVFNFLASYGVEKLSLQFE